MEKTTKVVRKTLTVRVAPELHAQLKAISKFSSVPIQKILADYIAEFVASNFDPELHELEESE